MNTSRPKVAISAGVLAPGGVETHALFLCLALRQAGIEVVVYARDCRWSTSTMKTLRAAEVKFCGLAPWRPKTARLRQMATLALWALNPPRKCRSLYWISNGRSHFALQRLARGACSSLYHDIGTPDPSSALIVENIRKSDACIANSHFVAERVAQIDASKPVRTIPFLTADRAAPPAPQRAPVGTRPLQAAYLSRLESRKRPDVLVREWKNLLALPGVGEAILHVHGQDEGKGMIEALKVEVAQASMNHLVKFYGGYQLNDLSGILQGVDVVLLPSEWEGLPLILLEAMQHGVPFVATAAGGTGEFGTDNPDVCVTGLKWSEFAEGFGKFIPRLRAGEISAPRLHQWAESRYGFDATWPKWREALTEPAAFFNLR